MNLGVAIRAGAATAALVAIFFPGPLFARARTESTVLMSSHAEARADQEQYGYSDAVVAGDLIFLSGIVAGKAPGETDPIPAYERVFKHIGRILKRAGADYDDIVEMTSYHTDVTAEIGPLAEVQKRYLSSPPPARTAIDVDRLLPDGGNTEIKVIARRPSAAQSQ